MTKIRPFLKWAGSKINCLESILRSFPPAKRLIEPFTGSGAIFINSNYENYLLGEENKDLIGIFKCLQQGGDDFIAYCAEFFTSENNSSENYYSLREQFNCSKDLNYKSALFLYLNRHGYNGLCRYNQSGLFNVPLAATLSLIFPKLK